MIEKVLLLLKSAGLIAALSGAFYLGFQGAKDKYEVERLQAAVAKQFQLELQLKAAIFAQEDLAKQLNESSTKIQTIREQVKVYVEPDKDLYCGPSTGVISMFNAARRPELSSDSPSTVEEGRTPSGYSATDFNDHNLDVIERYNALMIRYNKLVELLNGTD